MKKENTSMKVYFRADGDSEIGLGHIVRISAAASCIKEHYSCILLTRCQIPEILNELKLSFAEIIILPEVDYIDEALTIAASTPNALFVLDGYFFDSKYQRILTKSGNNLFFIDDIHAFNYTANVIINHSGGIKISHYNALPGTQFYLGPSYCLLRQPFLKASMNRRKKINNRSCFICFGGADPGNKTLDILSNNKVKTCFDFFHVVIGGANKHFAALEKYTKGNKNIKLYNSLSAEDMVIVMAKCSFAICSPSSVVYEYMSVGGCVFLEQIAENQNDIINFLVGDRLAFSLIDLENIDITKMEKSLAKQALYFDGKAGERLLKIFFQFFEARKLETRHAKLTDINTCFEWANDKDVRAQSFNQEAIDLSHHIQWFTRKLMDNNCYYYILEIEQKPVAQIRFEVKDGDAVLGYLADKSIRNKGLGTAILSKGIETFIAEYSKTVNIIGYVKESNIASQRSFERLAFKKEISGEYPDSFKYTMNYEN